MSASGSPFPSQLRVDNRWVGGNGGGEFHMIGQIGGFAKKITVYHGMMKWGSGKRGCLNGVEIQYTDGRSYHCGDTNTDQKFNECIIGVDKDERITAMSLFGMGNGQWDRTSEIYIETNKGTKFTAGSRRKGENEWKMDVGSGLLLGFEGRSGTNIDALSPIFLKPVARQYIDNVQYPTLDLNNTGFLQMQNLTRVKAVWGGVTGKALVRVEDSRQSVITWNTKTILENRSEIKISAKFPVIDMGEELSTSLTLGVHEDHGGSETKTHNLVGQWEKEMKGPDDQFELIAYFYSGKHDVEYTGTYTVQTNDGSMYSFPTSGIINNVIVSEAMVKVRRYTGDGGVQERSLEEDDAVHTSEPENSGEAQSYDTQDEIENVEVLEGGNVEDQSNRKTNYGGDDGQTAESYEALRNDNTAAYEDSREADLSSSAYADNDTAAYQDSRETDLNNSTNADNDVPSYSEAFDSERHSYGGDDGQAAGSYESVRNDDASAYEDSREAYLSTSAYPEDSTAVYEDSREADLNNSAYAEDGVAFSDTRNHECYNRYNYRGEEETVFAESRSRELDYATRLDRISIADKYL